MRNKEEFDRIARQKMSQRSFAFNEADWAEAQTLIVGNNRKRTYARLLWLLIPIAFLSTWLVWNGSDQTADVQTALVNSHPVETAIEPSSELNSEKNAVSNSPHNDETLNEEEDTIDQKNSLSTLGIKESTSTQRETKHIDGAKQQASKSNDVVKSNTASNSNQSKKSTLNHNNRKTIVASTAKEKKADANTTHISEVHDSTIDDAIASNNNVAQLQIKNVAVETMNTNIENNVTTAGTGPVVSKKSADQPLFTLQSKPLHELTNDKQLADARPQPYKTERWWKATLFGSLWNNQTEITGLQPEAWMNQVGNTSQPGFGAELMKYHHHFAFGTGVHYSTYGEIIETEGKYNSISTTYKFWYIAPVDTTILLITDSINNGSEVIYIGNNVEQTLYQIRADSTTTTTTTKLRNAQRIENRVSYIEIPLLADVHTGFGKCIIGLRGGPSIGKLITRTGQLPTPDGSGYQDLNTVQFQQWLPGYSLRGYAEYYIGQSFSVGLQSGIRGQFGNTLQNGNYTRTTSAWGCGISLSYFIRD